MEPLPLPYVAKPLDASISEEDSAVSIPVAQRHTWRHVCLTQHPLWREVE